VNGREPLPLDVEFEVTAADVGVVDGFGPTVVVGTTVLPSVPTVVLVVESGTVVELGTVVVSP